MLGGGGASSIRWWDHLCGLGRASAGPCRASAGHGRAQQGLRGLGRSGRASEGLAGTRQGACEGPAGRGGERGREEEREGPRERGREREGGGKLIPRAAGRD